MSANMESLAGPKMLGIELNDNVPAGKNTWQEARGLRDLYTTTNDLDSHAQAYYAKYPNHPPDGFDIINWKTKRRLRERSSYDWARVFEAYGWHYGFMRRLERQLDTPVFLTIKLVDLGFIYTLSNQKHYQSKLLIDRIKKVLRRKITGTFWWRIEVGINGLIHVHVICNDDTYDFDAFTEPVTDFKNLYWYLIKKIPYNAANLATLWKAKRLLLSSATANKTKKPQLVSKSGTVKLGQF